MINGEIDPAGYTSACHEARPARRREASSEDRTAGPAWSGSCGNSTSPMRL